MIHPKILTPSNVTLKRECAPIVGLSHSSASQGKLIAASLKGGTAQLFNLFECCFRYGCVTVSGIWVLALLSWVKQVVNYP